MYIIIIASRNSEAALGRAGGAQRSFLRVIEFQKLNARSARAQARCKTDSHFYSDIVYPSR
jgi:hypothetical protein